MSIFDLFDKYRLKKHVLYHLTSKEVEMMVTQHNVEEWQGILHTMWLNHLNALCDVTSCDYTLEHKIHCRIAEDLSAVMSTLELMYN